MPDFGASVSEVRVRGGASGASRFRAGWAAAVETPDGDGRVEGVPSATRGEYEAATATVRCPTVWCLGCVVLPTRKALSHFETRLGPSASAARATAGSGRGGPAFIPGGVRTPSRRVGVAGDVPVEVSSTSCPGSPHDQVPRVRFGLGRFEIVRGCVRRRRGEGPTGGVEGVGGVSHERRGGRRRGLGGPVVDRGVRGPKTTKSYGCVLDFVVWGLRGGDGEVGPAAAGWCPGGGVIDVGESRGGVGGGRGTSPGRDRAGGWAARPFWCNEALHAAGG